MSGVSSASAGLLTLAPASSSTATTEGLPAQPAFHFAGKIVTVGVRHWHQPDILPVLDLRDQTRPLQSNCGDHWGRAAEQERHPLDKRGAVQLHLADFVDQNHVHFFRRLFQLGLDQRLQALGLHAVAADPQLRPRPDVGEDRLLALQADGQEAQALPAFSNLLRGEAAQPEVAQALDQPADDGRLAAAGSPAVRCLPRADCAATAWRMACKFARGTASGSNVQPGASSSGRPPDCWSASATC